MKKICSFLILYLLFCCLNILKAQTPHFNHTTIYVVDLQKSARFYKQTMRFEEIPEPFHDNRHVWFKIGDHSELHVVLGAASLTAHDINIHLAFSLPSVEDFSKHLDSSGVNYGNWAHTSKEPQVRPDGIKQIYFQDPDGYWIEVNNDKF